LCWLDSSSSKYSSCGNDNGPLSSVESEFDKLSIQYLKYEYVYRMKLEKITWWIPSRFVLCHLIYFLSVFLPVCLSININLSMSCRSHTVVTFTYVHTHKYAHTCIHTHIHTQIHAYIHIHTHTLHTYIHTHTYVNTHIHTQLHTYIHIHTHYIHTHIHAYIHTYTHTYTHTHTQVTTIYPEPCLLIKDPLLQFRKLWKRRRKWGDEQCKREIIAHLMSKCITLVGCVSHVERALLTEYSLGCLLVNGGVETEDWLDSIGSRWGLALSSCEHGNESLAPIKDRQFLDKLSNLQYFNKYTVLWS
jgi:hypothetical protein